MIEGHAEHTSCEGGMHWSCCVLPVLGGILWAVGIISVVYAWMHMRAGNEAAMGWYWNALVFGILALFTKGKRRSSCRSACGGCANCVHACGSCK